MSQVTIEELKIALERVPKKLLKKEVVSRSLCDKEVNREIIGLFLDLGLPEEEMVLALYNKGGGC